MKTTFSGRAAESAVAEHLKQQKYQILNQNWRTRTCEIDLVAKKDGVIYFCEVKMRSSPTQGDGFEYITPAKLKQMTYAAEVWCQENDWPGDCRLLAAAVTDDNQQINIVEI